jgi:hypothetical protein
MIGYAVSMAMPVRLEGSRTLWGFQLAALSVFAALAAAPIGILGCLANVLFGLTSILALIRLARGRPRPSFGLIWKLAIPVAGAMLVSWGWLAFADGFHRGGLFDIGGWMWLGSGVALAIGSWRLRFDAVSRQVRGFEVIPVATLAPLNERDSGQDQRFTS